MKQLYKALVLGCMFLPVTLFSQQQQLPPVIEWQKCLGGSKIDKANSVIRTLDNGYLVMGTSFSNDGNVTGHHGTTDSSDAWVVKLDRNGSIVWQRSYGGTRNDDFMYGLALSNGDFICVGSTESTNGDVSGLHGSLADLWAVRIDANGNIIWSKTYGGTDKDGGWVIRHAVDGGYVIAGYAESADGDLTNHYGYADIWVLKINDNGAIQWQKKYGNYNEQYTNDLHVTSDGNYIIAGYQRWRGVPNCIGSPMYAFYQAAYLKIDRNGTALWENYTTFACGNPGSSFFSANLHEMPGGQYFFVGNAINATLENYARWSFGRVNPTTGQRTPLTPRFAPLEYIYSTSNGTNPNSSILLTDSSILSTMTIGSSNANATLTKINTDDTLNEVRYHYQKQYGGTNVDQFFSIEQVNESEYIAVGRTNSNNGDVSGNHGDYDFWVVKFSSLNKIKGRVFLDLNNNGIKDVGENYFRGQRVQSSKTGKTISSITAADGAFLNNVDTGNYTTTVQLLKPYYTINPSAKVSNFTTFNNKDSFDFALVPIPGKKDLRITVTALSPVRPGFNASYRIDFTNEGTDPFSSVIVRLLKPWNAAFVSASPAQTSVVADTINWNIGALAPMAGGSIFVTLKADPPPNVNNGEILTVIAQIDPVAGDITPQDNRDTARRLVTGSFDPNDKRENGSGEISPEQVAAGKSLLYTIRFQNTGTDTAFNVVIRDTLISRLDTGSIEMVAASHPYHLAIKDGDKLTWTFTDILLPDINTNEPASHGYVVFKIKPKTVLAIGDTIQNRAAIYFDFNPPVITNTELTIVKVPSLAQPSVSGLAAAYCSNEGMQQGKISNLPSPGSGITTVVKLDGNVIAVAADSTFSFDVSTLSEGTHVIDVIFTLGNESKTTTVNFNVSAAVTPDVNTSSNITTVVNLLDPVIITAVNAAGGGTTPLYTFGKDRNLNVLWQGESSNNVLNINPTDLQAGDNWIYVRMKTSSSCYTTQYNTDSIKITLLIPAPVQPVLAGLQATYCNNLGVQKVKLSNYPAQGTGTTVTVKLDGSVLALAADTSFSFNVSQLTTGNHVVEVTYTNLSGTRTTTANFEAVAPVNPQVDVTSNINSVSNLTNPVIFTATGNGAGNAPVYTFAKDRNFTRILQAEGASATLTLSPSSLSLGDNWIYVRIKTSLACYTQQTAIDSVLVKRFGGSGLVDPDFPDQRISATPNPFRSQLTLHGLSVTKSYNIVFYNQQGRSLYRTRITGRSVATMYLWGHAAGTYMVRVYDETKKRVIGTIEVVKSN
ncbi:MAG TPA: T9SS type A sorting domain-containing protein [Chitinophagaceae bacterium]